jgi:putative RecB family exonuclease
MEIEELRKQDHLSASGMNDYVECGLLYKLSRIDKFRPESTSDNLLFGSAIHQALADYQNGRMNNTILSLDYLQNIFEWYWRQKAEGNDNVAYSEGKDFNILLKEGKALLKVFYERQQGQGYRVLAIEEAFAFNIDGIDIPIIGITDLIEEDETGTIIVTDYKTSARAYSADEANKSFQLTLYYMAMKRNGFHDREVVLKLDCLIKTKVPKFEPYYTARSEADAERAIRKVQAIYNGIKKGVFVPNDTSWRCQNCQYKKYCNDWFTGG